MGQLNALDLDTFRYLDSLWNDWDWLMGALKHAPASDTASASSRYVDLKKTDTGYVLKLLAPSLEKKDIKVKYEDKYLMVNMEFPKDEWDVLPSKRKIYLPDIDTGTIKPVLKNGVLTITVDLKTEKKGIEIPVI